MMLLYEHPLSSYAQKVKIALREKGLDFKVETPAALGSGKADGAFAEASPRNEVPALVDGDVRIFDSTIILEYLEDKFPSPPLLPRDPAERARARMIEELCDTSYEAVNWGLSEIRWYKRAEGELAEKMKATAARQTAELQDWLTERLGMASGSMAPVSAGPTSAWRPASTARSTMASARHRDRRSTSGATASVSGRRSPRPSASSRRRANAWATPRRASRRAPSAANIAITVWNG